MVKNIMDRIDPAHGSANNGLVSPVPNVPVWDQDPVPLPGWSVNDQKLLIIAANGEKLKATKDKSRFHQKLYKISQKFLDKTTKDCEECFRHVESRKIVYFSVKK